MAFKRKTLLTDVTLKSKEDLIREMWHPKKTTDQVYNVRSYGAKGDGKSDDYKPLQKAIDAVYGHAKGGNLFFPPGQYRISAPLEVPAQQEGSSPVSWIGHTPETTSIFPSKPMPYVVRMRGFGGSVKGIEFRGNDPANEYTQYANVCMLASDIRDKLFSNTSFVWAKVHGLHISDEGNNNLVIFDRICDFSQNGTVLKGRGGHGSGDQVRFLAFNPKAALVHEGAYLKIGKGEGSVYHISKVTTNSITVSPELRKPLHAGTEYAIHIGSGLQTDRGNDNNIYGIYDCNFAGNAGAGFMLRGLYGHNIQGGNFDANGITGIHIGSGMLTTTPAYSNSILHGYFEGNGYANIILDYPSGLSVIEPLLAEPLDGTAGGIASITSLRNVYFDYDSTIVTYNGQVFQYIEEDLEDAVIMKENPRVTVSRPASSSPATVELPAPPKHKFGEVFEVYVDDSGGQPVHVQCATAKVNKKPGKSGVQVPAGSGFRITAYYSRNEQSWMVSYTTPVQ